MVWLQKLSWKRWLLLFFGCCLLFLSNWVFAADTTPLLPSISADDMKMGYGVWSMSWFIEVAERWLKMLYLILRPMLAVAAAAMDNSLVYGWAFHLTPMLFKFWQIIRTFANFTIGLYFVWSIVAAFFGNKLENVFSWLLKNVVLAAILVNMSRWIMAALIDLSTLATFTLWALPLHALKNDQVFKNNVYYMKTYANINLSVSTAKNADKYDFSIMYGCTPEWTGAETRYYLPCPVNDYELLYEGTKEEPLTRKQYKEDFINVRKSDTTIKTENIDDFFCVHDKHIIKNQYGANLADCNIYQELLTDGKEEWISQCATVDKIVSKAAGNTWPLYTIFSSILNMSELWITSNTWSAKEVWLNLLIKLVFWIALIIPLIALAVVMIIRVVYLWLIIAFAPLITIAVSLQRGDKMSNKIDGVLKNVLKPTQIISLVFLPVIATFWLSISIIFLSLLKNLPLIEWDIWRSETAKEQPDKCKNDIWTALWMERSSTPEGSVTYDMDITKINFIDTARKTWADIGNILAWTLINFFGIALMWMVVFATLKTNEFTKWVADTIDSTARKWMGTIPLPFAWWLWTTAIWQVPELLENQYVGKAVQDQSNLLEDTVDRTFKKFDPNTKKIQEEWKDPNNLGKLNRSDITENTNAFDNYSNLAKPYAQQAKAFYVDPKNSKLTSEGEAYAKTRGRVDASGAIDQKKAIDNLKTLDSVETREDALNNENFAHYIDHKNGWWGYENFMENRRKTKDKSRFATKIEAWLKSISSKSGTKQETTKNVHRFLRNNMTKLSTFTRDANSKNFDTRTAPKTSTINNALQTAQITENDINLFNDLVGYDKDAFKDLWFYKAFTENGTMKQTLSITKDQVTKTYTYDTASGTFNSSSS